MSEKHTAAGHLAAAVTIFIWGTTFISTKVLLTDFTPLEILFFRFLIGYAALWIAAPRLLRVKTGKNELLFAAAGLCGVTLYFLMENIALTLTQAANVSVIIAVAPFFTSLFHWLFMKGEKPGVRFLAGFAAAMLGISLLSFQQGNCVQLSQGRHSRPGGGHYVGGLFHPDKKDRKLRLRHHRKHPPHLLLRPLIHGTRAVLSPVPNRPVPLCRCAERAQHPVSRPWRFRPLLRNLELRRPGPRLRKNQRLYLRGSRHYGDHFADFLT